MAVSLKMHILVLLIISILSSTATAAVRFQPEVEPVIVTTVAPGFASSGDANGCMLSCTGGCLRFGFSYEYCEETCCEQCPEDCSGIRRQNRQTVVNLVAVVVASSFVATLYVLLPCHAVVSVCFHLFLQLKKKLKFLLMFSRTKVAREMNLKWL